MKQPEMNVASLRPDTFEQGGLLDDFDAWIRKVRVTAWDYAGTRQELSLAVAVTYETTDGDTFEQMYSAGDLKHFVPTNDGINPTDFESDDVADREGIYFLRRGKMMGLSTSSNWAQYMRCLQGAGFPMENMESYVSCLEGLFGHFNRVDQETAGRGGIQIEREGKRKNMVLVCTEVKPEPKAGAAGAAKAKPKPVPVPVASKPKPAPAPVEEEETEAEAEAEAPAASPIEEAVSAAIIEAIANSKTGKLPKQQLPPLMLKVFSGPANVKAKAQAINLVSNIEWLGSSELWQLDGDTGTLSIGG